MFAKNNHSMMGSDEDPKDGGAVAVAVFGAVGVYGVCFDQMAKHAESAMRMLRLMFDNRSSSSSAHAKPSYTDDRADRARLRCGEMGWDDRLHERVFLRRRVHDCTYEAFRPDSRFTAVRWRYTIWALHG